MTAYEMRIRDWSSDVCSSDLGSQARRCKRRARRRDRRPERRDGKGRSHRPSRASAIASAAAWREHRGTRSPRGAYRSDDDAPETMPVGAMIKTLAVAARDRARLGEILAIASRFGLDTLLARHSLRGGDGGQDKAIKLARATRPARRS